jgi:hypothetical protein
MRLWRKNDKILNVSSVRRRFGTRKVRAGQGDGRERERVGVVGDFTTCFLLLVVASSNF